MSALLDGALAGYGIAIPVGAIGVLLVQLSAASSRKTACAAALGVASADGVYAVVALFAGAGLAPLLAPVVTPLRWIGAAVLVSLAVRNAISAWRSSAAAASPVGARSSARAYVALLGLTMLNPTTVLYFAALLLGRQHTNPSIVDGLLFVVAAFLASASWQLLLAGSGRLLGRLLTSAAGRRYSGTAASAIIVALAAGLVIG